MLKNVVSTFTASILATAIFPAFVLTTQVAVADVVDECHSIGGGGPAFGVGGRAFGERSQPTWVSRSKVSIRACTEIIDGPNFGLDQKALAYRYRGEAHMYAGAVKPAIADFSESIRLKENMSAFEDRGWVKFTAGDFAGSIADYSEAIRLSPASVELYIERGHIYAANGKADEAIRDLTEALRLSPSNANAFNTRGIAYTKKGDLARAEKDYTAAIAINPRIAIFYANRGYLYEFERKTTDAVKDLQNALRLDPSLIEAMKALKRVGFTGTVKSEQLIQQGKELAEKNCGSCHAVGATGVSPNKDATEFRSLHQRHKNLSVREPIERAIDATHDHMPEFKLSDREIDAIVAYIDTFVPNPR